VGVEVILPLLALCQRVFFNDRIFSYLMKRGQLTSGLEVALPFLAQLFPIWGALRRKPGLPGLPKEKLSPVRQRM
jgi:hypothetical protein